MTIEPMLFGHGRWPHVWYDRVFRFIGYGFFFSRGAANDNGGAMLPADSEG